MFNRPLLPSQQRAYLLPLIAVSLIVTLFVASCRDDANISLVGAGASFPAPLYQRWFAAYSQLYPNVKINYQSIGSSAGVQFLINGTVDFAASDVAITEEQAAKVERGVISLPITAGSVVLAYNLPNVKTGLRLPREVYTDIFLGKIKNWNHPTIAAANPGVHLPKLAIEVIHRSDGSGTTNVFTQHLSAISPEWKTKIGSAKTVEWPIGIGAKGNEGVTAFIEKFQGAIGYVEYSYALQNQLKMAALENKSGNYITPTPESAARALEEVELPVDNLIAFNSDPKNTQSYPIVTYSWLLTNKQYFNSGKTQVLKNFLTWALTEGQQSSLELGYIPLPKKVVVQVHSAAKTINGNTRMQTTRT